MNELLRRIAVHGGLTAVILAVIGFVLGEMAATAQLTPVGTRLPPAEAAALNARAEQSAAEMRRNVPIAMALMGFVFVAAVEGARHLVRGKAAPDAAPAPRVPDEAEKLLEELLTQAEAKSAARAGAGANLPPGATPSAEVSRTGASA
jgi:hypothetical protein